ncbi:NADAR family protein [Uliginosibacterium gangwonense]|uniref:NADAR family protein n=1 Tax=Uliginosibacterium gangwonense TaxID=392736 RepID=UPI00037CD729|nr:NADAR family protein [Uliginosibacterium gangwonense]
MNEPIYFYTKSGPFYELSNFAPYGFALDGAYWPTVEHYFQAQKFTDAAYKERIRTAKKPKEARALGQSRQHPIHPEWDLLREQVMLKALRLKFENPKLRDILRSTGQAALVEASPFDYFWGAGHDGSGQNRLGRLLEQIRQEIQ